VNIDSNHISWPDLLTAIDQTHAMADQDEVYKHLATCKDCLRKWQEIRGVKDIFTEYKQTIPHPGKSCLDEEKVAVFLDQGLPETELQEIQKHITGCDYCFFLLASSYKAKQTFLAAEGNRSAIPSKLLERVLSLNQSDAKRPKPGWFTQQGNKLRQVIGWISERMLSPVPGYTLAGILLLLLLWQRLDNTPGRLIAFPETSGLLVFADLPISYRDNTSKWAMAPDERRILQREPLFSGMTVEEQAGQGLIFNWPKIEGVPEYHLTLFTKTPQEEQVLLSITTNTESYKYSYDKYSKLTPDHIYEWVISGKYGDGLHFKVKASFAIVR
jgi:hypothetical protein